MRAGIDATPSRPETGAQHKNLRTACDFRCKNLKPKPSLLETIVEQWLEPPELGPKTTNPRSDADPLRTIRRDPAVTGHRPLLRASAVSSCLNGFCNSGQQRRPGFTVHHSRGSGVGRAGLPAGEALAVCNFRALGHTTLGRLFCFLRRRLLSFFASLPSVHSTPGVVRRSGAYVFVAARARPRDARHPRLPDGAGVSGAHRRQRISLFICGVHDDGDRNVRPDGNAALQSCSQHSGQAFQRSSGTSASCLFSGAGRPGADADDSGGRRRNIFPDATHVDGIHGRIFIRNRSVVGFQRSRSVGADRADPAVESSRHAHSDRWRPGGRRRSALARRSAGEFRRAHLVRS